MSAPTLLREHCESDVNKLDKSAAEQLLEQIDAGWSMDAQGASIAREFKFKNYYHTIAFVNALAWIANQQDHHPDLEVGYNRCAVHFSTHSVDGLSRNDFICAARADALVDVA
jgi:4a-hydroxytetrahydrobiopterin dehydratase